MLIVLSVALVLGLAIVATARLAQNSRRCTPDAFAGASAPLELRELDAHLDRVAREELERLETELRRYVAGAAGHVVTMSTSTHGIALELSDGHRLALGGTSRYTRRLLAQRTGRDILRPADLDHDAFTFCLLLRGQAGTEIEVHARNIVLVSR